MPLVSFVAKMRYYPEIHQVNLKICNSNVLFAAAVLRRQVRNIRCLKIQFHLFSPTYYSSLFKFSSLANFVMEDQNGNSKPVKAYIIRKQYEEGIFVVDFWTKHFPRFSVPLSRLNVECDPLTGNCVILSRESRDPTQLHVTKCTDASVLPLKVCENSIEVCCLLWSLSTLSWRYYFQLQVKFLPLEEYLYPSRAKENNLVSFVFIEMAIQ